MSRNKGINKLVVSDDTTPSLQELPVLASETLGVFVHSTNSTVPSKLFLSQGTATQASFSRIEFDTDSGLGIFTDVPFVSSHDASIKFKARGTDYWKIEGVNGSSGDLLPLINNQLKIGRSGFNLAETFSRKITSDSTLALAAGGATKWNLDSGGNLIPSTANSQNFGATTNALSQIFGNQLNSGTGQALYLGSNGGAYQWRIANGTNAAFIPNSTYDIGASGSRVGKLWGTDIDVTGTINSGGFSSSGDVITNSIRTIGTSDNLVIKTGTGFAEKVRITSEGNVGIRTSNPICALDVQGVVRIGDSASSNFRIDLGSTGVGTYRSAYVEGLNNDILFANQQNGKLRFFTNNSEKMTITPTGKVGIGTTSPYATLDVNSSLQIGSSATSSNNFHITAESTGALQFWNGNYGTGTELIRITSGGNVGIGTSSPVTALDVVGTATIGGATSGFLINLGRGTVFGRHGYISGTGTSIEFNNQQNGDLWFCTNNTEKLRITSGGNVGIGTIGTTPLDRLDVASEASGFRARFRNTTANEAFLLFQNTTTGTTTGDGFLCGIDASAAVYVWNHENNAMLFGTKNEERMRIAAEGNVGIGTTNPLTKLDVSGSIRSSSQLISTVATGTAPLSVSSTTLVTNLNADLLDGLSATSANTGSTIVARDASGNFSAGTITANLTGTATTATYLNSAFSSSVADNITTRVNSGFWETSTATTAEGWPETTNGWYHLLASTHSNTANYYSMQFAGKFDDSNALYYRATNGSGTTAWNRIWHSGNDTSLGTASNVASTIVRRDASSNIYASSLIASSIIGIPFSELNLTNITNNNISITTPLTSMEIVGTVTSGTTTGVKFSSVVSGVQHDCGIIKAVGTGSSTKMVIYANRGDGGLELRTNRPSGGEQPALLLDKTGISYFYNDIRHDIEEGTKPNIGASGGAGFNNIYAVNFVNTSDLRLKENIEKIEDAQNIIMQLNPVKFDWKNNTNQVKNSGFIAQEVHKLIPECVISGDDEVEIQEAWGISMNHVIPYLTKALQEAFEEIQKLKERIEILES